MPPSTCLASLGKILGLLLLPSTLLLIVRTTKYYIPLGISCLVPNFPPWSIPPFPLLRYSRPQSLSCRWQRREQKPKQQIAIPRSSGIGTGSRCARKSQGQL
ncbi:hypothetical protein J3F83DRAFT_662158 [Trichoderma novae-zelandiae]